MPETCMCGYCGAFVLDTDKSCSSCGKLFVKPIHYPETYKLIRKEKGDGL